LTPHTDPDTASKQLGDLPDIHRTASVRDSTFGRFCEVGARTKVAECSFGDFSYVVNDSDIIYTDVGKFCSIAAHTRINPGNHPVERVAMNHFTYRSSAYGLGNDDPAFFDWRRSFRCRLGHDVWLGHGVVVLPGVSMGNGAVAGAGAVVTKDVPAFAIVVGNPARVLRYRFPPDLVSALELIAWWDWPHERLAAAMADFRGLDVNAFCQKYG
jgi:phosphonate metabolism protein (transferase hexapeptide repeat family)